MRTTIYIEGLAAFYGQGFDPNKLPQNSNLEEIDKKQLYTGLENATRYTSKGCYGKGKHSFKILACLDGKKIHKHGKYSIEFFDYLQSIL